MTKTQDRGILSPTDSEVFHKAALMRRLEQLASMSDDSLTQSSDHSHLLDESAGNRKFNLNQFIHNSVYPSECTQNDDKQQSNANQTILNASFLIDHTRSGRSSAVSSRLGSTDSPSMHSGSQPFDPNETFVDEDLILSLTQRSLNKTLTNETLNENEQAVLDIFEMMEQDENDEPSALDDTLRIDDDSTLAPLSQPKKSSQTSYFSQKSLENQETTKVAFEDEQDSDDDLLNQFSMSIIDHLPDLQKTDEE